MSYSSIVSPQILLQHFADPDWLLIDARFNLSDPDWGQREYEASHIPFSQYAHLNHELSSEIVPGKTGRHPLPCVHDFAKKMAQWGITKNHQLVIYDQREGMFAARLWWMLRWCGLDRVAVLDGGWTGWLAEGGEVSATVIERDRAAMDVVEDRSMCIDAQAVLENIDTGTYRLIDARAEDRFRGENETIDVKAGHIPGAVSSPFLNNVDAQGRFLSVEKLRAHYEDILQGKRSEQAIVYCGSGVTAAHNILAMYHAGLGMAKLYPGSWSEWITENERPIAVGLD